MSQKKSVYVHNFSKNRCICECVCSWDNSKQFEFCCVHTQHMEIFRCWWMWCCWFFFIWNCHLYSIYVHSLFISIRLKFIFGSKYFESYDIKPWIFNYRNRKFFWIRNSEIQFFSSCAWIARFMYSFCLSTLIRCRETMFKMSNSFKLYMF